MKIVMLSDTEAEGGAAIAANRLAQGWCDLGHEVIRLVNYSDGENRGWAVRNVDGKSRTLLRRIARHALPGQWAREFDGWIVNERLETLLKSLQPDAINIHNLHGAAPVGWSPEMARVCSAQAPTVWTLHDMWSFTGRCAYSYDCRKFITGCDATCPTPTEYPPLNPAWISTAWTSRQTMFEQSPRLAAATPSRWMASEALLGLWAKHRVEAIPNGLPLQIYRPLDRESSRRALHIGSRGPVVLMVAQYLDDRRKGAGLLMEGLKQLGNGPVTLVTLGGGTVEVPAEMTHIKVCRLGHLEDETAKVQAYSAADILVHPAPADNFPNVILESIACGTPALGFRTGGIAEMIRPGVTGWLADSLSAEALGKALVSALDKIQGREDLRRSCRAVAEAEFDVLNQAKSYLRLFESLRCS